MSWQDYTLPLVRTYIGDLDGTSYSNSRLTTISVTAAHSLLNEVSFSNTYTVDVPNSSISPDPTSGTIDTNFLNLLALKTALILSTSEARTKSLQVFSIKDGPSSVETGGAAKAMVELSKLLTEAYNKAKLDYIAGNSVGAQAITTPVYTQWANPSMFGFDGQRR